MIEFLNLEDANAALNHSPLLRAVEKTFTYIEEHGGIGLTPSTAFKRTFVHWAAAEFDWPGYSHNELFRMNKVLNELDFMPLGDLHALLLGLKIGRHYKKEFKLTKSGHALIGQRAKLFGILTPAYLFNMDHSYNTRMSLPQIGNWDIFLNVLNVETENSATGSDLRKVFFGPHDHPDQYDNLMGSLYVNVLRPLCWTGLLFEHESKDFLLSETRIFSKTPLWRAALRLDTDDLIRSETRH